MGEPLRLFGFPLSRPLYGAEWLLTNAQLELLSVDIAVTVYGKGKGGTQGRGGRSGKERDFRVPSRMELERSMERWRDKYGKGKEYGDDGLMLRFK